MSHDIITYDMGGTSTDACMIRNGTYGMNPEGMVGWYPNRVPQIDINTVGAGGGGPRRLRRDLPRGHVLPSPATQRPCLDTSGGGRVCQAALMREECVSGSHRGTTAVSNTFLALPCGRIPLGFSRE